MSEIIKFDNIRPVPGAVPPTDRRRVNLLTNFTNTAFPAVSVSQLSRVSSMAAEVEAAARPRRAASVVLMMGGRQVVDNKWKWLVVCSQWALTKYLTYFPAPTPPSASLAKKSPTPP